MEVAHVLRKYVPSEWGGVETALVNLVRGLNTHGIHSSVYCPSIEESVPYDPLRDVGARIHRYRSFLPIVGLSPERRKNLISVGGNIFSFELFTMLMAHKQLNLIHAHTLNRIGAISARVAQLKGIPLVVSVHGGYLDLPPEVESTYRRKGFEFEWGKALGMFVGSRNLIANADAVITCNIVEEELIRRKFPEKQVIYLPNSIDHRRFASDHRQKMLDRYPLLKNKKFLLMLGRIDPVKNQKWAIENSLSLLKEFQDLNIVLAGSLSNQSYFAEIKKFVESEGLSSRFFYIDDLRAGSEELTGLLQAATLSVLASKSETFGIVILESWAAGTPVVASSTSGAKTLIEDGANGMLFTLDEPATYVAAVKKVLNSENFAKSLIDNSTTRFLRNYSYDIIATKMEAIYANLVGKVKKCAT